MTNEFYRKDKYTEDEMFSFFNFLIDEYNLETYEDCASMCKKLALFSRFVCSVHDNTELDDAERVLLTSLQSLLNTCAKMFTMCDNYYRYSEVSTCETFPNVPNDEK